MSFDMRNFLSPRRLTIAMWDGAYMLRRNKGDQFMDWDRSLEELKERGYNTIRIDAFPGVIDTTNPDMEYTWPDMKRPYMPWCWTNEYKTKPARDLVEFINLTNKKGLNLSLSAWWEAMGLRVIPKDTIQTAEIWVKLLEFLKVETGLENIVFIDLCNEIPGFLPGYDKQLENSKFETHVETNTEATKLAAAPPVYGSWNTKQLAFLKNTLDGSLKVVQKAFPEHRFTYSMNMNSAFGEVGFENLDLVDMHFFLSDSRFDTRVNFEDLMKDAYETSKNYKDFSDRCKKTIKAVGPMMRQKQRAQLKWASEFSQKIGTPLVTTEAWASWFYVDHNDLDWDWINDWCETAIDDAIEYGLWGITTNNYAEPHFNTWKDIRWHLRLNEKFLNS